MPPVIAAAAVAAGVTGTIGGISIATLIGEGVTLGGIFALGQLTRPRSHATAGSMETIKQSIPPRVRAYGRVKIGGALYFQAAPYILTKGIVFCEGPIDAFEQIWLGNAMTVYAPGAASSIAGIAPWTFNVRFNVQTGTIPQSRNPGLSGPAYASWWDTSHAGHGLANIVMNCFIPFDPKKNFSKVYPSGIPAVRAVLRGEKIFDPRDGTQSWANKATWKWSDNPSLCILDFLTSARGYNIPNSRIDLASFTAFANLCDTGVLRYDGATEKNYVCWGSYRLDEEPRAVLSRLLLTCDGELVQLGNGTIAIRGGDFTAPSVSITSDMILGYEVQRGPDKMSVFNQYRVHYTEPAQDYQLIEGAPYDDVVAQAQNGGQVISQDLELAMVPSRWQAMRLAQIYMARENPDWVLTITTNIAGLDALSERIVHLTIDELALDGTFLVKKFDISGDLRTCAIALSSLHINAYTVAPPATDIESIFTGGPDAVAIPDVTGFVVTRVNTPTSGGAVLSQLQADVTPPEDTSYSLHAQISTDGGTSWTDLTANGAYSAISNVLQIGQTYLVRAAFSTFLGADGTFTTPVSFFVSSQLLGPISQALLNGINQDYGLASVGVTDSDDFGLASDSSTVVIDLGLASA